jgi:hypothetical protein
MMIANNHPAGMSVIGESRKPTGFDLEARGIPLSEHPAVINSFFDDRVHYGDACVGVIKSFYSENVRYAKQLVGPDKVKFLYIVRNPIFKVVSRWKAKVRPGRHFFRDAFGRDPSDESEVFRSVLMYFAHQYYMRGIRFAKAKHCPIVRIEDINRSIHCRSGFFKRLMEWLTGTPWPQEYIDYIREHNTPAYQYRHHLEWENPDRTGRVDRVVSRQREKMTWSLRNNWEDDAEAAPYWEKLEPWQQSLYKSEFSEIERLYGYNISGVGVETSWAYRGQWWGEVNE